MNVRNITELYDTPFYIYELDEIKKAYFDLKGALPDKSGLLYSVKANPHPKIVEYLMQLGCGAEISSKNELDLVLHSTSNIENCLYTGPGKTSDEIEYAIRNKITNFSIESNREIKIIHELAKKYNRKINIVIRINPNNTTRGKGLSMAGISSQFGIDEDKVSEIFSNPYLKYKDRVNVIGFHIYTGSNINDEKSLLENFENNIKTAMNLVEKLDLNLKYLNLGGGFGHPYANNEERKKYTYLKRKLEELLNVYIPDWKTECLICFESGRYLVGSCGKLVSLVEDVKESKGRFYTILDSGINHLGGMSGLNRIPKVMVEIHNLDKKNNKSQVYSLVGPLCSPLDILSRKVYGNISIGDKITISNVGAYGLTASLIGFLSRDSPLEIVVDKGEVSDVSRIELNRKSIHPNIKDKIKNS